MEELLRRFRRGATERPGLRYTHRSCARGRGVARRHGHHQLSNLRYRNETVDLIATDGTRTFHPTIVSRDMHIWLQRNPAIPLFAFPSISASVQRRPLDNGRRLF
jgi:hypothetical protein